MDKLSRNLDGIREMKELPRAVFVIDTKREQIAVNEARRLNIPIIGIVDTNADPDEVDYVIPGNDDAIRSVALMCRIVADGVLDGRAAAGQPVVTPSEQAAADVLVSASDDADVVVVTDETSPAAPEPGLQAAAGDVVEDVPAAEVAAEAASLEAGDAPEAPEATAAPEATDAPPAPASAEEPEAEATASEQPAPEEST
jgi:small subunit ribosomal protein S2